MVLLHILRSKYQITQATLVKRLLDLEQKLPKTAEEAQPVETPAPKIDVRATPAPKVVEEVTPAEARAPVAPAPEAVHPSRYQTLLQFAAIELEGSIKKEI